QAFPEGVIESELFGHEKGSFTGANESRKGYFEIADGGTIFLDEVAELPLTTQVRLLRVIQTGEFIKVGSSKVQKTNVRVVAATNINLVSAIQQGHFREDLYYRLNTVPIIVIPLRKRKEDIYLLFRKFVSDIALQYKMPAISLTDSARVLLENYMWPGNIRQLKNVAEQISVIEENRIISETTLEKYLPAISSSPAIPTRNQGSDRNHDNQGGFAIDREMMYSVLREMRMDISDIKRMILELKGTNTSAPTDSRHWDRVLATPVSEYPGLPAPKDNFDAAEVVYDTAEEELTKEAAQREAIIRALNRHQGKRKEAAKELFISERTLYRRIKELGIDENKY
ncbi:MAG: sigma 54-interacting transcriptional regulator, partial [Rikenellaceae bacterium]